MFGNRALEAIKRLLTADTYVRSHNQPTERGRSTTGPEDKPETRSSAIKPEGHPRPEVN